MVGLKLRTWCLLENDSVTDAVPSPVTLDLNRPEAVLSVLIELALVLRASQVMESSPPPAALGSKEGIEMHLAVSVKTVDPGEFIVGIAGLSEEALVVTLWNPMSGQDPLVR